VADFFSTLFKIHVMKNTLTTETSVHIDAAPDKVWDALTNPDVIEKYFFGTHAKSTWKPGSPVKFTGEWEGKTYEDKGTVLENREQHFLKYSYWSSMSGMEDKPENYATITYKLEPDSEGSNLTVIQDNIPDEKMKAYSAANWNMVLDNLKKLLENKK
jgi:uncharacterized protein YndB with AHSA1/START domain